MAELGNALLLQVSQLEQRLTSEADTVRRMQVHVAEKRSQLLAAQREVVASESALGVHSQEVQRLGLVRETKAAMLDARAALHAQLGAECVHYCVCEAHFRSTPDSLDLESLSELQRVEVCLLANETEQNAAFLAALQANEASIRAVNELGRTHARISLPASEIHGPLRQ